ncbi:MAG: hypothetical protein ACRD30_07755 [Bryobacteraceae bacterium]
MPAYRIHRLKDHLRQHFRSAPHLSGAANVKPRDYEPPGESEAALEGASPYALFFALRDSGAPLEVGDLVEDFAGALRICKFVGFEEARWVVPEPQASPEPVAALE